MSESAGASATFSQSASPTSGLTAYDLEGKAKRLYPSPDLHRRRRRRAAAGQRLRARLLAVRGSLTKGHIMTIESFDEMLGTLRKSVDEIVTKSTDDERTQLLEKTFKEFGDAARDDMGKSAEAIEGEILGKLEEDGALMVPLFKGLGSVGAIANLVGTVAERIKCIKDGLDWPGQTEAKPDADVASPMVAEMLDHWLAMGEIVLRAAVNEHVEPLDDDDDPDDLGEHVQLVVMPHPDEHDGDHKTVGKSALPEDLLKFATHPDMLADAALDAGAAMFGLGGIDQDTLGKMLAGDGLAKADPAPAGDPAAQPPDATADAGGALPPDEDEDPLDVAMRIAALLMVQLDHIKQMVDGDDTGVGEQPDQGNEPNDGAQVPADQPPAATKGAGTEGLQKNGGEQPATAATEPPKDLDGALSKLDPAVAELIKGALSKRDGEIAELSEGVKKLLAMPRDPKGPASGGAAAVTQLSKNQDASDALAPDGSKVADAPLGKRGSHDPVVDKIKESFARPIALR